MDFTVDLACLHQRIVLADAHHMPVVQHDNLVGVAQGRGALGDDEERRFLGAADGRDYSIVRRALRSAASVA